MFKGKEGSDPLERTTLNAFLRYKIWRVLSFVKKSKWHMMAMATITQVGMPIRKI